MKISRLSYKNISKCLQVILNSSQGIVNSITNLSTDNERFAFKQRFSIIYSNRLTSFCIMKSQARLQISRFFNCIRKFLPLVVSKKIVSTRIVSFLSHFRPSTRTRCSLHGLALNKSEILPHKS